MASTYGCSLALVIELDPRMDMDKMTYVFSMEGLAATLTVLQQTAENVQDWAAFPDVNKPPRGKVAALPLHGDLTCTPGGALGAVEVLAASVEGKVEFPRCSLDVDAKKLLPHTAAHILENEVRLACRKDQRL